MTSIDDATLILEACFSNHVRTALPYAESDG